MYHYLQLNIHLNIKGLEIIKFHRCSYLTTKHALPAKRDHCCNVRYSIVVEKKNRKSSKKCVALVSCETKRSFEKVDRLTPSLLHCGHMLFWHVPVSGFENGGDWRQIQSRAQSSPAPRSAVGRRGELWGHEKNMIFLIGSQ